MNQKLTEERASLEQTINELDTTQAGIKLLTRMNLLQPIDIGVLRIVQEASARYGCGFDETLELTQRFVKRFYQTKKQNSTFSRREIESVKKMDFPDYDSALELVMGFKCSTEELSMHCPPLLNIIDETLDSIRIRGEERYTRSSIGALKNVVRKNGYSGAVARIVVEDVASDAAKALENPVSIQNFAEQFGISVDEVRYYISAGILRTGTDSVVHEAIKQAESRDRYKKIDLRKIESELREACLENSDLEGISGGDTISNSDEFLLTPVHDLIEQIYSGSDLAIAIGTDYVDSSFGELHIVKYKGKLYFYNDPENPSSGLTVASDLEEKLRKSVPLSLRRTHIAKALECKGRDLNNVGTKFSCLVNDSEIDPVKLEAELINFKKMLYDGKRLALEVDAEIDSEKQTDLILLPRVLLKMVQDRTLAPRVFLSGMLHRDDVEPMIRDVEACAKSNQTFERYVLGWFSRGYALFSHGRGINVDGVKIIGNSIPLEDFVGFGKGFDKTAENMVFFYRGEERVYSDEAREVVEESTDLTMKGLCAKIDFVRYNDPRMLSSAEYIRRQLDIREEQGIEDSNSYVTKDEGERIKSVLEYLESIGRGVTGNFVGRASTEYVSFYTQRETRDILGTTGDLPIEPDIPGVFPLYSSTSISSFAREFFPSRNTRRYDCEAVRSKLTKCGNSYEVLILGLILSTTVGSNDHGLFQSILKLPSSEYNQIRASLEGE